VLQETTGVALFTVIEFDVVAEATCEGLLGVKFALSVCVPAFGMVPAAGEYVKVPG
jgi:hypothetical protein